MKSTGRRWAKSQVVSIGVKRIFGQEIMIKMEDEGKTFRITLKNATVDREGHHKKLRMSLLNKRS